jgi:hypothetical protein
MKQKGQVWRRVAIAASVLAFLAGNSLMADQPTVKFFLNGTALGGSLDGIYTSPYQAQINDVPVEVPVICDDFANNSYVPETWTAYLTTLDEINAGTGTPSQLKWGNADSNGNILVGSNQYDGWNLDQKLAYDVAAYLAIRIMQTSVPSATLASEQYSYAMWELFDANDHSISNYPDQPPPVDTVVNWLTVNYNDPTTLNAATQDVENAIDAVCGGPTHPNCSTSGGVTSVISNPTVLAGYNVNVYTYQSCISGPCTQTSPPNPPQEFITVTAVPESSSLATLGGYLLFGGLSLLFFRRRRVSVARS